LGLQDWSPAFLNYLPGDRFANRFRIGSSSITSFRLVVTLCRLQTLPDRCSFSRVPKASNWL